jgi:hypothetical protein
MLKLAHAFLSYLRPKGGRTEPEPNERARYRTYYVGAMQMSDLAALSAPPHYKSPLRLPFGSIAHPGSRLQRTHNQSVTHTVRANLGCS